MRLSREQLFTFIKNPKEEESRLSRSTNYYLRYWDHVYSKGQSAKWNWASFFLSFFWAIYRGMYSACAFLLAAPLLEVAFLSLKPSFTQFCVNNFEAGKSWVVFGSLGFLFLLLLMVVLFLGFFGNRIYFWWIEKKIKKGITTCPPKMLPAILFAIGYHVVSHPLLYWFFPGS